MRELRPDPRRATKTRRGSAIVEFTLVGSFIFLPMLAGLATVGMNMVTAMQVAGLNASAGQMLASGVDFSLPANQTLLQTLAGSLNTSSSGSGVVIVSEIDQTSAGPVCSSQILIPLNGGTNASKYVPAGTVTDFTNLITLVPGQSAFLAETYYNNPQLNWSLAPTGTGTGIYVKNIF